MPRNQKIQITVLFDDCMKKPYKTNGSMELNCLIDCQKKRSFHDYDFTNGLSKYGP